jgi:hypothetical protein
MHDRPKTNSTKTARVLLSLGALALSVPALTSCNIVTPVAYIIEGPGQIEAEFTLADKKTVVFVDDPRNILPRSALLTAIGDGVSFDLMEREILSSTVSTAQAISVARGMSEAETLGRLLNEVGHLADDCGGHWRALALIEGGRLRTLCADMPADAKAMAAAMGEYRKAGGQ